MKKQNIGFGLFLVYLGLSVIDFLLFFRVGSITTIAMLVYFLDLSSKLGLVSKMVMLAMFGLLFTSSDE